MNKLLAELEKTQRFVLFVVFSLCVCSLNTADNLIVEMCYTGTGLLQAVHIVD